MTDLPVLEMKDVVKRFEGSAGPLEVLKDVSVSVRAGETLAIMGPSGSGKSTLLNIAGTLDRPTEGWVLLAGRDMGTVDDDELARVRNQQIGFIFQLHHLLPQCTALENVLLPCLPGGVTDEKRTRALHLLERVDLADRQTMRPGRLSGGERQRVAVVRALINSPGLLLADEPTGSLDAASAERLVELLVEISREEHAALVLVTHAESVAGGMQRRYRLNHGRLETVGA